MRSHVRMADESFPIGPPPPGESYLAIDHIIDALVRSGAEAVHPGFGFLAENARFVEAVEAAGAVFIGPPARAVAAMGDKIESKRIADAAGVSVVPAARPRRAMSTRPSRRPRHRLSGHDQAGGRRRRQGDAGGRR